MYHSAGKSKLIELVIKEILTEVALNRGPRVCPGQQLATANVRYLLVRLMQEFKDVQSRDDRPWVEHLGLAIKNVNGVHIALTPA
jgi:cytochrome P450